MSDPDMQMIPLDESVISDDPAAQALGEYRRIANGVANEALVAAGYSRRSCLYPANQIDADEIACMAVWLGRVPLINFVQLSAGDFARQALANGTPSKQALKTTTYAEWANTHRYDYGVPKTVQQLPAKEAQDESWKIPWVKSDKEQLDEMRWCWCRIKTEHKLGLGHIVYPICRVGLTVAKTALPENMHVQVSKFVNGSSDSGFSFAFGEAEIIKGLCDEAEHKWASRMAEIIQ